MLQIEEENPLEGVIGDINDAIGEVTRTVGRINEVLDTFGQGSSTDDQGHGKRTALLAPKLSKGGEEENPLVVMQTQLDMLQLAIEEKQVAMRGDIEKSLSTSMDNKQDLAQLLLKLTMLSGAMSDIKQSINLLDARMDALAAAQEVPEHEKPERQAENLI